MWRFIIPGAVFAILIGFFVIGLNRDPSNVPSPLIGKAAPTFSLAKVEDPTQQIGSKDFAGRKHLVNVWATWCVECRREHEMLLSIAQENVVPVVGIDWKDDLSAAQQWLKQLGNPYSATAFDVEGRTAIDFGVYGAPETFLVDERGFIVCKHTGAITAAIWQRVLKPVIQNQAPDKTLMGVNTVCAS